MVHFSIVDYQFTRYHLQKQVLIEADNLNAKIQQTQTHIPCCAYSGSLMWDYLGDILDFKRGPLAGFGKNLPADKPRHICLHARYFHRRSGNGGSEVVAAVAYSVRIYSLLGGGGTEPAQHLNLEREGLQPFAEGGIMLLRQYGGRHQHGNLTTVHDRLESGAYRHLRLAVADITADQPVHGLGLLHIDLDVLLRLELVGRLDVGESSFHLLLPETIAGEGITRHNLAGGIKRQQLTGKLLGGLFGFLPGAVPTWVPNRLSTGGLSLAPT